MWLRCGPFTPGCKGLIKSNRSKIHFDSLIVTVTVLRKVINNRPVTFTSYRKKVVHAPYSMRFVAKNLASLRSRRSCANERTFPWTFKFNYPSMFCSCPKFRLTSRRGTLRSWRYFLRSLATQATFMYGISDWAFSDFPRN